MEFAQRSRFVARQIIFALVRIGWVLVRLPVLALLVVLEPFACGLLWLFATFGILGALFYRFLVHDPRFPFWPALGLSVGMALLAGAYYGLIRLFGGPKE
jgi:hypothetical protein